MKDNAQRRLPSVLLELPVAVVEWAYLSGLQPSRDAVEVECVLRRQKDVSHGCHGQGREVRSRIGKGVQTLQMPHATVHSSVVDEPWFAWHSMPVVVIVRLAYLSERHHQCWRRTQVHNMVPADGAVIDDNIPSP